MKLILLLALLTALLPAAPLKVLTIGNSFTRNATKYLKPLAAEGGHELLHSSVIVGGSSLELHANRARAHAKDPADKKGLYDNGKSLLDYLRAEKWDIVTIQQVSIKSHNPATYQPHADYLAELIRREAPTARLLWHQTWAYRVDDPRFRPGKKAREGEPTTQAEMFEGLQAAYYAIARHQKAGLIPSGNALYLADTHPEWGYQPDPDFDPKSATHPAKPKQKHSLHVGWKWQKKGDQHQLRMDGHHANQAGEYLGSCVFYERLFKADVRQLSHVPKGLDPAHARFLRETAHQAVTDLPADLK
ncbi:MAG: DUF4886 domain-containing protein [Verrucomicrobiales bacterium]